MYGSPDEPEPVWWNPFSWFNNVSDEGKLIIGGTTFVLAIGLTIFTGGALLPVFISASIGVASGTLIGGFGSVISSGGCWSQFGRGAYKGFVDGVLWSGIFAFAGSTIGAIKYKISTKGSVPGTEHLTTIKKGQRFDRYGKLSGRYITNEGTPINKLALPPNNTGIKTTLQASKNFRVYTSVIDDAFGQTGGGIQYVMRYSIENLIARGWIVKI